MRLSISDPTRLPTRRVGDHGPPTPLGDPITVGPGLVARSQTPTTLFRAHARARGSHYFDPSPHAKPRPPGSGPCLTIAEGVGTLRLGDLAASDAQRAEVDAVDGLVDLAADSGREEVVCGVVSEGDGWGVVS